jgi:hypothetical protein
MAGGSLRLTTAIKVVEVGPTSAFLDTRANDQLLLLQYLDWLGGDEVRASKTHLYIEMLAFAKSSSSVKGSHDINKADN